MTGPNLPVVRHVLNGRITREGGAIVDASSSVSLIDAGRNRIIVDTGSPQDEGRLVEALTRMEIRVDSVSHVVNTHMHVDHCGCNDLFTNARVVAHKLESPPVGSLVVTSRQMLAPSVEMVPTPGHTRGSLSVFVVSNERTAICGDAVPTRDNFEKWLPPSINIDSRLALESMELVRSWADVIVPGHDAPFSARRKE